MNTKPNRGTRTLISGYSRTLISSGTSSMRSRVVSKAAKYTYVRKPIKSTSTRARAGRLEPPSQREQQGRSAKQNDKRQRRHDRATAATVAASVLVRLGYSE